VNLEQLQRLVSAEPDNISAQVALIQARARITGACIYLKPLRDLKAWQQSPAPIQDLAIQEITGRLEGFAYLETRTWRCPNTRAILSLEKRAEGLITRRSIRRETVSRRLASYIHIKTGMILNLLPGHQQTAPFLIGRWAVTTDKHQSAQEQAAQTASCLPHTGVDCHDAKRQLEDWGLRLPTATEWDYACRTGTNTPFFWGDQFNQDYVWYADNSDGHQRSYMDHERSESWNAFGLVDMIGNIWEWVDTPVARGGFLDEAKLLGSCCFDSQPGAPPDFLADGSPTHQIGFRAACDIPAFDFAKKVKIDIRPA
jgi:hypothetical protein